MYLFFLVSHQTNSVSKLQTYKNQKGKYRGFRQPLREKQHLEVCVCSLVSVAVQLIVKGKPQRFKVRQTVWKGVSAICAWRPVQPLVENQLKLTNVENVVGASLSWCIYCTEWLLISTPEAEFCCVKTKQPW